jgi:hypothetical protein
MRNALHSPIAFPILVDRRLPQPAQAHAGLSGVHFPVDPRRMSADRLSRTRRCPPPVEDDSGETLWLLSWVLLFTIASWHFW